MILSLRESLPERAAIGKAKSARAIENRYKITAQRYGKSLIYAN